MKLNKVAFAVASALASAAGASHAGQIDSSSTTLAREVINTDAQIVRAPSKTYSFVGVIDARTNEQRLQLQWKLHPGSAGGQLKWSRLGDVALKSDSVTTLVTADSVLRLAGKDEANDAIGFDGALVGGLTGATVQAFLAENDTVLVFNVTIPANSANYIKDAVFQINAKNFLEAGKSNVGLIGALSVAKQVACVAPDTASDIEFLHYTSHNGNTTLMSGVNSDSEHQRNGHNSKGRYLNFTENLNFTFAKSGVASQIDAASLRTKFLGGSLVHKLGQIQLNKIANGLDLDYTNSYGKTLVAADFNTTAGAVPDGTVDLAANGLTVKVVGNRAAGSSVKFYPVLTLNAEGKPATYGPAVTTQEIVADTTAGSITYKVTAPADIAAFSAVDVGTQKTMGVEARYEVTGSSPIPDNGDFVVTATLTKEAGAGPTEQANSCFAPLSGLGNSGIKIDVRNYASFAKFGTTGPSSTLRIINNSETRTADLYAQMIYADGTYGAWGQLPDLAPRAVMNISNKDLEALMTKAAATNNPFDANAVGYATTGGNAVVAGSAAGVGDRVRIVSNTGSTLRVQSYMVVGNMVLDTSSGQGVDFENAGTRVPDNAKDAQPVSQDAINGLAK